MNIEVEYNGRFPNLCSGALIVTIDGTRWEFPDYCMCSGGSVSFDEHWSEEVTDGEWGISEYPDGFPEELKGAVEDAVNASVPWGCCSGCV